MDGIVAILYLDNMPEFLRGVYSIHKQSMSCIVTFLDLYILFLRGLSVRPIRHIPGVADRGTPDHSGGGP